MWFWKAVMKTSRAGRRCPCKRLPEDFEDLDRDVEGLFRALLGKIVGSA